MEKKKILICGVTGFIGRNIAETLAGNENYEVHGVFHKSEPFENERIHFHQADLIERRQVDEVVEGMDVIIQAAATTSGSGDTVTQPYIHVTDNAVMNSYIMRAAFDHGIEHLVFFSCTVFYQSSDTQVSEDDLDLNAEIEPKYFGAGWTKLYLEKMCEFYAGVSDLKVTVIRHSNIYGPHDKYDLERSHVFGATVSKVMNSTDGKVVVWGDGNEKRDLLYITDLVDFVISALERQKSSFGLYNVGSGQAISIKDLVQEVIEESGRELAIEYDLSKPTIKFSLSLDCAKAERELGWTPQIPFREGIKRTLEWYKKSDFAKP